MSCPTCDEPLVVDPDGGWCSHCNAYWPPDLIEEYGEEQDGEEDWIDGAEFEERARKK